MPHPSQSCYSKNVQAFRFDPLAVPEERRQGTAERQRTLEGKKSGEQQRLEKTGSNRGYTLFHRRVDIRSLCSVARRQQGGK
jgi:hypothetical protein